jgi:hypothetical protein
MSDDAKATEPLRVTLHLARETKNTVRFEEPEGGEPPVIGTLYVQKWAVHRLGDPESITVVIEPTAEAP